MPPRVVQEALRIIRKRKEPDWVKLDQQAIEAKKEKFLHTKLVYKSNEIAWDEEEAKAVRKEIGHGANLDAGNVKIAFIKDESGKASKYLVKKSGTIDSVFSSIFFRIVSAGRYFAKNEVIIHDEASGTYYTAIKFENKIASKEVVLTKELAEKQQTLERLERTPDPKSFEIRKRIRKTKEEIEKIREDIKKLPDSEKQKTKTFVGGLFEDGELNPKEHAKLSEKFKDEEDFLACYSYMLGVSQPLGEADSNPMNYTYRESNGKLIPGRFDLTMCANIHPQPFGFLLIGKTPAFQLAARELLSARKYYNACIEYYKGGKTLPKPQSIKIEGCSKEYQEYVENCAVVTEFLVELEKYKKGEITELPRLQCNQDSPKLLKEISAKYANFKTTDPVGGFEYTIIPHKHFFDEHPHFFSSPDIDETFRTRVYGCHQSLIFFLTNIAGQSVTPKHAPMMLAVDEFPMGISIENFADVDDQGNLIPPAGQTWTKELLEQQAAAFIRLQNASFDTLNKDDILKKLKETIDSGTEEGLKAKKNFIAFMYGIQKVIDFADKTEYLDKLEEKLLTEGGEYCAKVFQQHRKFLTENARQAQAQFGIFLDYYREIRDQLKTFDAPIRKTPLELEDKKKRDFKHGETVTLPARYLKDANKSLLKEIATDTLTLRKKIKKRGESERVKFQLNPFAQTEIEDVSLTKAAVCDKEIFSRNISAVRPFDETKFDDRVPLFTANTYPTDQKTKEIHVNFGAKYIFGDTAFTETPGGEDDNNKKKILKSSAGITIALLQQRSENESGGHFLDMGLGQYSKTSGTPILIQGQNFAQPKGEFKLDELEMHFVRDRTRLTENSDAAKHIFATAYQGFMLCGNKEPGAIVRCGIDEKCWVNPYTQMAMLILAERCANAELGAHAIDLRLTGNFLDKEDKDRKFEYFKKVILPQINEALKSTTTQTVEAKLGRIVGICDYYTREQESFALSQTDADNTVTNGAIAYQQRSRSISAQLPQPSASAAPAVTTAPSTAALEPKTVQLVKLTRDENLLAIQKDIDAIIDQTAAGNPAQKTCILILLDSLAEYGLKHLKNEGAEINIDSIMKGGGNVGFTAWKDKPDFRQILLDKAVKHNQLDLNFNDEKTMKYFSKLSSAIQLNSQNRFSKPEGRHYQGSLNTIEMARSWRIALLRNIDGPSLTKETTQQTR